MTTYTDKEVKELARTLKSLGFRAKSGTVHKFIGNHDSAQTIRITFDNKFMYLTPAEADWFRYGYAVGRNK